MFFGKKFLHFTLRPIFCDIGIFFLNVDDFLTFVMNCATQFITNVKIITEIRKLLNFFFNNVNYIVLSSDISLPLEESTQSELKITITV